MNSYIVLLRGINVGGKNKLPMAELRELLTTNGYQNVSTYIQSGNIVLSSDKTPETINDHIHDIIKKAYEYAVPVITLTRKEVEKCVNNNPYVHIEADIKKLHVTFLQNEVAATAASDIPKFDNNDTFKIVDKVVYVHCPDGYGKTKLTNGLLEKKLKAVASTRNWRTTLKLLDLIENHI